MTVDLVAMVIATLLGPILAVQAQKFVERATDKRRTRRMIFHMLMSQRATRLSDDFVRALNMIDLEFTPSWYGNSKDKAVIDAWRSLFGEYQNSPGDEASEAEKLAWNDRINDYLVNVLQAMSKALHYDFSKEQLRRGIYYPRGRADLEETQRAILTGLKQVLRGNAIPMKITEVPASPELLAAQLEMLQKTSKSYSEDGPVMVRILPKND